MLVCLLAGINGEGRGWHLLFITLLSLAWLSWGEEGFLSEPFRITGVDCILFILSLPSFFSSGVFCGGLWCRIFLAGMRVTLLRFLCERGGIWDWQDRIPIQFIACPVLKVG